jgi:hypothetical protein
MEISNSKIRIWRFQTLRFRIWRINILNPKIRKWRMNISNRKIRKSPYPESSESWWSKHLYEADCTFVSSSVLHSLADPLSIDIVDRLLPSWHVLSSSDPLLTPYSMEISNSKIRIWRFQTLRFRIWRINILNPKIRKWRMNISNPMIRKWRMNISNPKTFRLIDWM